MAIRLFLYLCMVNQAVSLTAYNCAGESTAMTRIDAVDVAPCEDVRKKDVVVEQQEIQILQVNDNIPVKLKQCLAEEQVLVYHCGMYSHASLLPHVSTLSSVPLTITPSDCKAIHKLGKWVRGPVVHTVKGGGNVLRSYLAGKSWGDGNCMGGQFTYAGNQYNDVVVASEITLIVQDALGSITKGKMLVGNVMCDLEEDFCQDDTLGTIYWDVGVKECTKMISVLYTGPSWSLKSHSSPTLQFVNSTTMTLYIEKKESTMLCGKPVSKTTHLALFIAPKILSSYQFPIEQSITVPDNILLLQTRLYTLSLYLSDNLKTVYETLTKQICSTERSALISRIMALPQMSISPWSKGTYAKKMGEVVYLFSCSPVAVSIGKASKCVLEMPVVYLNQTMYMEPITKLLIDNPTEVECEGGTPPVYKANNLWIEVGIKLREANPPKQLVPTQPERIELTPLHTGKSGIYSDQDLEMFNEALFFQRNRESRLSQWATDSIQSGGHGILSAINPADFQTWLSEKLSGFFGWWFWFGSIWAAVSASIFVFNLVMSCVSAALSAKQVHQLYGCTKLMFCAFWQPILEYFSKKKEATLKVPTHPYEKAQVLLSELEEG